MKYLIGIWCIVWCSVFAKAQNLSINFQDTLLCINSSFKLPYNVSAPVFVSGNTFTAELSDAFGSFVSPLTIGTKSSTVSDTILCTIPPGTLAGTQYRIRVVSNNPVQTSTDNGLNLYLTEFPQPSGQINSPLCQGDTLTLFTTNLGNPIDSFVWYGPQILGVSGNPVKRFGVALNDSGFYIVKAYYRGCRENDTVHLTVKPNPANIFSTVNTPLCEDDTLWLKANSSNATSYLWTGPAAFSANVKDTFISSVKLSEGGKYYINAFLDGCKVRDSIAVTIKQRPRPSISYNTPVCETQSLTLQTSKTIVGETYLWNGPNSFSDTTQQTTITPVYNNASGKYIISVSYNGCTGKDSASVIVKPLPAKPFATSNSPLCAEDSIKLYSIDTIQGTNYSWTGIKNYSAQKANPTIPDADTGMSGIYTVTANLSGCTLTDTTIVKVKPRPELPIITSNSPLKPGSNLYLELKNHRPGWGYKWSGPKGFFSQAIHPGILNVDTAHSGTYFVTVTYDGCTNSNMTLVQIDYATDTGVIILFPNPNNGSFMVHALLKKDQDVDMAIVSTAAQEVYKHTYTTKNKLLNATIDLSNRLASGIYYLTLIADDDKHTFKFEVQR